MTSSPGTITVAVVEDCPRRLVGVTFVGIDGSETEFQLAPDSAMALSQALADVVAARTKPGTVGGAV